MTLSIRHGHSWFAGNMHESPVNKAYNGISRGQAQVPVQRTKAHFQLTVGFKCPSKKSMAREEISIRDSLARLDNVPGMNSIPRTAKLLISMSATVFACGCTSFLIHTHQENNDDATRFYSGTTTDAVLISHPNIFNHDWYVPPALVVTYGVLDIAPSFAVDTLLLPIDLTHHRTNAPSDSPSKK